MSQFDFSKNAFSQQPEHLGNRMRMPISERYGSCMSLHHPDNLDNESLNHAQQLIDQKTAPLIHAADIGSSPYCPQALRFASLGLHVDAYDLQAPSDELLNITSKLPGQVSYNQIDLFKTNASSFHHTYHIVYSNRCFLFLPFDIAKQLLQLLVANMHPGARGYFSLGNIDSREAINYSDQRKEVGERFSTIDGKWPNQAGVNMPICLYHLNEIEPLLLRDIPVKILLLETRGETLNAIKLVFEKSAQLS